MEIEYWDKEANNWVKRLLILSDDSYIITEVPQKINDKKSTFSFQNSTIEEESNYNSFTIKSGETKHFFRTSSNEEKGRIMKSINDKIQPKNNEDIIALDPKINEMGKDIIERMSLHLSVLKINIDLSNAKNKKALLTLHSNLMKINSDLEKVFEKIDNCIIEDADDYSEYDDLSSISLSYKTNNHVNYKSVDDYKASLNTKSSNQQSRKSSNHHSRKSSDHHSRKSSSHQSRKSSDHNIQQGTLPFSNQIVSQIPETYNMFTIDNSNEENGEAKNDDEFESCPEITKEMLGSNTDASMKRITNVKQPPANDYNDPSYDFPTRGNLNKKIKYDKSFFSDLSSLMKNKQLGYPIYYYEPLSRLQVQCEKFYYSDLLTTAATQTDPEIKLCYIMAFIAAQYSLKANRVLRPFNPLIGETYEFIDNEREYRYIAEQVSDKPPITAYRAESKTWAFFGDTRAEKKKNIFKGCKDLEYQTKQHIVFKNSKDYYTYNKPKDILNGITSKNFRYNIVGNVKINNANNPTIKGDMEFMNEKSKTHNGEFEGRVLCQDKVKYIIKGNWKSYAYYQKPNDSNTTVLWNVVDENYLNNVLDNYCLPSYSCNLNNINDSLKKILPLTDSRRRPDLREYEEGDTIKAAEMKVALGKRQKEMLHKFSSEKKVYHPQYFHQIFHQYSNDHVYVYKGGYWENRKNQNYPEVNSYIFQTYKKDK